jgi:hypothetical protein
LNREIHVPYRQRSDTLAVVVEAASVLPADEARVMRQLVPGVLTGGSASSAGEASSPQ